MQTSDLKKHQDELNDALIKVAVHRDEKAFAFIFDLLSDKLRAFAMTKLRNDALARELVQDTLMTVWRKASMYNIDKGAASTWIYTIARNLAFDLLRRNKNKESQVDAEVLWPVISDDVQDRHDEQSFAGLDSDTLKQAVNNLPDPQRQVVELLFFAELTQQQTADKLAIPVGTVKSRLRLAMARLRGQIL